MVPGVVERDRGEPWLDDGSVVLIAQGTAFRVHRSVLTRNSDVFADMFQVSCIDPDVLIEGCPVVELLDDPLELGYFLQALYDGRRYFSPDSLLPFGAVVSLLRLGIKYQAADLRDEGLRRIQSTVAPALLFSLASANTPSEYRRRCSAIGLANLAYTHDVDELLPLALYACCQIPLDQLRDGIRPEHTAKERGTVPENGIVAETLHPANIDCCLAARPRLQQETEHIVSRIPAITGFSVCGYKRNPDRVCWLRVKEVLVAPELVRVNAWDPYGWLEVWWGIVSQMWLCSSCSINVTSFHHQRKRQLVEKLTSYFGLGSSLNITKHAQPSC